MVKKMGLIKIKRGLDVPISGEPEQKIETGKTITRVALLGDDYVGMKPSFSVSVGDRVKLGQLLFIDKKMPAVKFTSPGTGTVKEINRGEKRAFKSIVIELGGNEEVTFPVTDESGLSKLTRDNVTEQLIESGLWPAFRARPFSRSADPQTTPNSIFITAMDSNPLAPSLDAIIAENKDLFLQGITVISKLTEGTVYLCKSPDSDIPTPALDSLEVHEFAGPHPAGLVGTHIHFLDPVNRGKTVWHIGAQDVIAIGHLFVKGKLLTDRIISLAGPGVKKPRLIRTRLGAAIDEICKDELSESPTRVVSGSILSGHTATETVNYLGRFHQQVSSLLEGGKRVFFGWLSFGLNRFSALNIVISRLFRGKKFNFTTDLNGGKRPNIPLDSYERVMPLDLVIVYLLRSLLVDDIDEAEKLGLLELDEEDLALCTFVSPAKIEYGPVLRRNLTTIEKEG